MSRADHLRVVVVVAAADVFDVGGGRLGERARDDDAGVAPVLEVRRGRRRRRPRHAEPGVVRRRRHPRQRHAKRDRYSPMLHRDRESLHHSFTQEAARERIVLSMQQKLSELTAAASGGIKVAQALRLLEDLELGLGPSH